MQSKKIGIAGFEPEMSTVVGENNKATIMTYALVIIHRISCLNQCRQLHRRR